MFSLKPVSSVGRRVFLSSLALLPTATTLAQSGDNDPRSPGGRYLSPPINDEAVKRLVREETKRELDEEGKSLAKSESWVASQQSEQDKKVQDIDRQMSSLNRRKAAWRCPAGLSVDGCYAHPPVHREAVAFRAWYNTELDRLNELRRRARVSQGQLDEKKASNQARRRVYEQKLNDYRNSSAKKSKRSPDEGLFIDESAPRRR